MHLILKQNAAAVVLVKPQFEAGKGKVGKKGVVREPEIHLDVLNAFIENAHEAGFHVYNLTFSPIKGPEGNIEFLGYIGKDGEDADIDTAALVAEAHGALDKHDE